MKTDIWVLSHIFMDLDAFHTGFWNTVFEDCFINSYINGGVCVGASHRFPGLIHSTALQSSCVGQVMFH